MTMASAVFAPAREFQFGKFDFDRVRRMIYEHAGITLTPCKEDMVYSRPSRRLRVRGLLHFAGYLALLDANDTEEWEAFTNSLSTNRTAFFCRNVMIYFDKNAQRGIVKRFVVPLQPEGLMFAGHSESFFHCTDLIRLRRKTVYELANMGNGTGGGCS